MFHSLQLKTEITQQYKTNEKDNNLENLSRINIFIGPNNSGKSRFMRDLFIEKEHKFDNRYLELNNYINLLNSTIASTDIELKDIYHNGELDLSRYCIPKFVNEEIIQNVINELTLFNKHLDSKFRKLITTNSYYKKQQKLYSLQDLLKEKIDKLINILNLSLNKFYIQKSIYIPILRGLRSINYQNERLLNFDAYKQRTIDDYFKESGINFTDEKSNKSIYTGLSFYEDVQNLLLGDHKERQLVRDFENFLSKTFFQNKQVSIIPRKKERNVYVNIEGEPEDTPIYNLGEGVQAIIILTYPLFFNKGKNLKIYIEEPDVYLHPGFQRILIETLLNTEGFEKFQYFFTTHSNHFLDMTLDYKEISVYKFTKVNEQFNIDNIDNPDITLLEHLGVKNSSVFLTNCTIWVEGITDRIYIRKYLELYQENLPKEEKKYFEDVHYSFVEYGGNNITHWSFLDKEDHPINVEKLCGKLFLLTDNDNVKDGSEKFKRIQQLQKNLGERYYCLNVKEIENLLTKETLLNTLKLIDKTREKESIKFKDKKKFNENTAVGTFIDNHINGLNKKYKNKSGTITDKVQFAQGAIEAIKNFEDVRPEAKLLTEKIYNFIKDNN